MIRTTQEIPSEGQIAINMGYSNYIRNTGVDCGMLLVSQGESYKNTIRLFGGDPDEYRDVNDLAES